MTLHRARSGSERCRIDTQPNHWFRCALGTTGCPRIHDGRTPHCIQCAAGGPCQYQHDPPVLEMDEQAYRERHPPARR